MLRADLNERLTRVGPGTPMGALLRRYWHPAATVAELQQNPVRKIRLLGENLTLFKDRRGTYGLIGERCAHRRVSLGIGMPEEDGLRCMYHGWKYDHKGQCIDMPAEPEASSFKDKVKLAAYPVQELGGLIWAYLGPEPIPLLPRWDLFVWKNVFRQVGTTMLPANWLQCQENSADSWHAHFTHGWFAQYVIERMEAEGQHVPDVMRKAAAGFRNKPDVRHSYEAYRYGMLKRRLRQGETEDAWGWKVGHPMVFPNWVRIGKNGWYSFQMRIPIDDTTTRHLSYECFVPGPDVEVPPQDVVPVFDVPLKELPDFILGQDYLAWTEQEPIVDRSQEMLGTSDRGVILLRQMLQDQMAIVEDGGDPINVFRDPAANEIIELPTEDYGDMSEYQDGAARYYDTGPYGYVDEADQLLRQARAQHQHGDSRG